MGDHNGGKQGSLGYEAENILIDDINEFPNSKGSLVIEFSSRKESKAETKLFSGACGVVYHEIKPLEGENTMREYTPTVGDSLD